MRFRSRWLYLTAPLLVLSARADVLEERRVEGDNAIFLAQAMKDSGAKKEAAPEPDAPADHPQMKIAKDFVYRMESVTCREGTPVACEPFKVPPEKMKRLTKIFRDLGVKKTVPPKSAGKKAKPFYFMKD